MQINKTVRIKKDLSPHSVDLRGERGPDIGIIYSIHSDQPENFYYLKSTTCDIVPLGGFTESDLEEIDL